MRKRCGLVFLLAGLCFFALAVQGYAQTTGIISRSTNLRAGPSSQSAIRGHLAAADEVTLLSPNQRNGYFHVKTATGITGWIYSRNVRVQAENVLPPPPAPQPALPQLPSTTAATRAQTLAADASTVQTHTCTAAIKNALTCHQTFAEGCTKSKKANTYDPFLNFLKNQTVPPDSADQQVVGTLTSLDDFQAFDAQARGFHLGSPQAPFANQLATIGQGNIYQVIGYLYYAMPGGSGETCNCKLPAAKDSDFHIGIGFDAAIAKKIRSGAMKPVGDPDPLKQKSVVVEMTPYYRALFHKGWTLDGVKAKAGQQVKVVGQLIVDTEHNEPAQNCAFPDANPSSCWRGSAFEIHPVTRFYVCKTTAPCSATSSDWIEFDPH